MIKNLLNNVHHIDCLEFMKMMPENCIDAIVTDPPYELGFMGKAWDKTGIAYSVEMWAECLRLLKPGGHMLAFSAARTYHRMACAIEDAGFQIRDQIMWVYGSGFPKSRNLDGEFKGWGTALKPAHEPICLARKPLEGTITENMQQHGTGGINIASARIGYQNTADLASATWRRGTDIIGGNYVGATHSSGRENIEADPSGRWPANFIHDGSDEVLAAFPETSSGAPGKHRLGVNTSSAYGTESRKPGAAMVGYGDSGNASRFFYCAKASKQDRDEGLEDFELRESGIKNESGRGYSEGDPYKKVMRKNIHPTVKPTKLMQYLCRLITPPGGVIYDPFTGSGSTGKASVLEGFNFIGNEIELESAMIANARMAAARKDCAKNNDQMSFI